MSIEKYINKIIRGWSGEFKVGTMIPIPTSFTIQGGETRRGSFALVRLPNICSLHKEAKIFLFVKK